MYMQVGPMGVLDEPSMQRAGTLMRSHSNNAAIYWDAGHCQDLDSQGFIAWIGSITGYHM